MKSLNSTHLKSEINLAGPSDECLNFFLFFYTESHYVTQTFSVDQTGSELTEIDPLLLSLQWQH